MIDAPFHHEQPVDVAFCLYSTAEARALKPVIRLLHEAHKTTAVIAFGAAQKELADIELVQLPENAAHIGADGCWNERETTAKVTACARIFFTGLGSRLQVNSAEAMHKKGARVIGFLDSFETLKTHAFASQALPALDKLLVPTHAQTKGIPKAIAVGNCELDHLHTLPPERPHTHKPTILYTGGYGPIYEAGFALFVQALKERGLAERYHVLIALHPAPFVDGAFERALLGDLPVSILPKNTPIEELYLSVDRVVTCTSSTLMHALHLGLPACYLFEKETAFSNVAIEAEWAPALHTAEELTCWLEKEAAPPVSLREEIPPNAAENIFKLLAETELRKEGA